MTNVLTIAQPSMATSPPARRSVVVVPSTNVSAAADGAAARRRRAPSRPLCMPAVVGAHIDVAIQVIEQAALAVHVVTTEVRNGDDRHVLACQPEPGTSVLVGQKVFIVVGIARNGDEVVPHTTTP